jgi:hypothetical protein
LSTCGLSTSEQQIGSDGHSGRSCCPGCHVTLRSARREDADQRP